MIKALRQSDNRSLSARRAWIEISSTWASSPRTCVALRKESVDRNDLGDLCTYRYAVALRKESVDRNKNTKEALHEVNMVALRKESVDRNYRLHY